MKNITVFILAAITMLSCNNESVTETLKTDKFTNKTAICFETTGKNKETLEIGYINGYGFRFVVYDKNGKIIPMDTPAAISFLFDNDDPKCIVTAEKHDKYFYFTDESLCEHISKSLNSGHIELIETIYYLRNHPNDGTNNIVFENINFEKNMLSNAINRNLNK